jgi:formylmethanofuran dehydrogenase subunit C
MLELAWKREVDFMVDGSLLNPERLVSLPLADLLALPLPAGGSRTIRLEDLFWLQWHSGPSDMMVLRGDCSRVHSIGSRMTGGTLVIDGAAGDRVGLEMEGGTVIVSGNAGNEVGSGMRGGMVAIAGNCGDRLGMPRPGERSGIRGGDVYVAGNVGERACHRMRRGTVWIAGNAGEYLAPHMIAGTIFVHGKIAPQWGQRMRRGSLLFSSDPDAESGASLSPGRNLELSFLPLVWNHLRGRQSHLEQVCAPLSKTIWPRLAVPSTRWVERRIGDLAEGGRGEVLILKRLNSHAPTRESSPSESGSPAS